MMIHIPKSISLSPVLNTALIFFSFDFLFSLTAVTNFHRLAGLKQQNLLFHSFGGHKSEIIFIGLNSSCQEGNTPSMGSRQKSLSCLSQFMVIASIPWLITASLQSLPLS